MSTELAADIDSMDIETWKRHLALQIKHDLTPQYEQARVTYLTNKHAQPTKEQEFRIEFNRKLRQLQELAERQYKEHTRRERRRRSNPPQITDVGDEREPVDESRSRDNVKHQSQPEWFNTFRQELNTLGSSSRSRHTSNSAHTPLLDSHQTEVPLDKERLRRFAEEQARLSKAHSSNNVKGQRRASNTPGPSESSSQQRWFTDHRADSSNNVVVGKQTRDVPASTSHFRSPVFEAGMARTSSDTLGHTRHGMETIVPGDTVENHHKRTKEDVYGTEKVSSQKPTSPPSAGSNDRAVPPILQDASRVLKDVDVLFFDLLGTILDWHGTVTRALKRQGEGLLPEGMVDWGLFAREWRTGYITAIGQIAEAGLIPQVKITYRDVLDAILDSERWASLGLLWDDRVRENLISVWHYLDAWPETGEGLRVLKEHKSLITLSNIPLRTQVDMSKHAGLTWDAHLSGELLGFLKPDPGIYLQAARYMPLPTSKCAMVSAHILDLQAAAGQGMKTIYLRRHSEDEDMKRLVKTKSDGGEVDIIVDSLTELATVLEFRSG